jgi:hypothetical protein
MDDSAADTDGGCGGTRPERSGRRDGSGADGDDDPDNAESDMAVMEAKPKKRQKTRQTGQTEHRTPTRTTGKKPATPMTTGPMMATTMIWTVGLKTKA